MSNRTRGVGMDARSGNPTPLLGASPRGGLASCLQPSLCCGAIGAPSPPSSAQLIEVIGHKATASTAGGRRQPLFLDQFLMQIPPRCGSCSKSIMVL